MAESLLVRKAGGGGAKIEEALQTFTIASGQTITAGTFVDYINGNLSVSSTKNIYSTPGGRSRVAYLNNNKIVVAIEGQARVGTISGDTITWGNFSTYSTGGGHPRITKVDDNKIVVIFSDASNSSRNTSIVGIISGDTITWGNKVLIEATNSSGTWTLSTIGVNRVVVFYNGADGNGTGNKTGTISGNTITWSSFYGFGNTQMDTIYSLVLNDKQLLVLYAETSGGVVNRRGVARVITINASNQFHGYGSPVIFSPTEILGVSACVLPNGRIVLFYHINNQGAAPRGLRIMVTQLNENTMNITSAWAVDSNFNFATNNLSVEAIDNNKVVMFFEDFSSNQFGALRVANIENHIVSFEDKIFFDQIIRNISSVSISSNKILFNYQDYGSNYEINQNVAKFVNVQQLLTNANFQKVFGLAKTGGTAGQTVEVFVNE
jgi:hypothetical protein